MQELETLNSYKRALQETTGLKEVFGRRGGSSTRCPASVAALASARFGEPSSPGKSASNECGAIRGTGKVALGVESLDEFCVVFDARLLQRNLSRGELLTGSG